MKKIFLFVFFLLALAPQAHANPLTTEQKSKLEGNRPLLEQMDKMILSVADLDILLTRDKILDYEIIAEDAKRILDAVAEIKKIDKDGIFKDRIKRLEQPTQKLYKLATKKDPRVIDYTQKIFEACFNCHKTHRKYPYLD